MWRWPAVPSTTCSPTAPPPTPQVVIHPGQRCTTLSGEDLRHSRWHWASAPGATAKRVPPAPSSAPMKAAARSVRDYCEALPGVAVLRAGEWDSALPQSLSAEAVRDGPGQEAYLDRLLDLLLLDFLRTWFGRPGTAPPWWTAESDAADRSNAAADLQQPGTSVDGCESCCRRGHFTRSVRTAVHRTRSASRRSPS